MKCQSWSSTTKKAPFPHQGQSGLQCSWNLKKGLLRWEQWYRADSQWRRRPVKYQGPCSWNAHSVKAWDFPKLLSLSRFRCIYLIFKPWGLPRLYMYVWIQPKTVAIPTLSCDSDFHELSASSKLASSFQTSGWWKQRLLGDSELGEPWAFIHQCHVKMISSSCMQMVSSFKGSHIAPVAELEETNRLNKKKAVSHVQIWTIQMLSSFLQHRGMRYLGLHQHFVWKREPSNLFQKKYPWHP